MKLGSKITLTASIAVVIAGFGSLITVYSIAKNNRIDSIRKEMAIVLAQANTVAEKMDALYGAGAINQEALLERAHEQSRNRSLRQVYDKTDFYQAIPIVASWQAAQRSADELGYELLTPSHPDTVARNQKNDNGLLFKDAFDVFDKGGQEHFRHDKEENMLIYSKPVKLAQSCLTCHGDPATSLTGDGKDILGFDMEDMKYGDIKGAFVLKAPLSNDPVLASTMTSMSVVSVLILGFVISGFYLFNRRFVNAPLDRAIETIASAVDQTARSADEIASASQSLAEGASEQAASLEETSATLEEISSMASRNSETAGAAKDTAAVAIECAEIGYGQMKEMQHAMNAIVEASESISVILKDIDDIAFQTNILALNAAVEAARAGEAGSGFAVVADEVRSLAQRCASAAKETGVKIGNNKERSIEGLGITREVTESFEKIQSSVKQLNAAILDVVEASGKQREGVLQVNGAVAQMDTVMQRNAASSEETAGSSEHLKSQSVELMAAVESLRALVGSDRRRPAPVVKKVDPDRKRASASSVNLPRNGDFRADFRCDEEPAEFSSRL